MAKQSLIPFVWHEFPRGFSDYKYARSFPADQWAVLYPLLIYSEGMPR